MLSATPLYGNVHSWMSADRVRMCGLTEDSRKLQVNVNDGESPKTRLELREDSLLGHSLVDAAAAHRMDSLAALGMDRSGFIREGLRVPGGIVYSSLCGLSAEKTRDAANAMAGLVYTPERNAEMQYKASPADSLDSSPVSVDNPNGFNAIYKAPPGLQKSVSQSDVIGLDRAPGDKASTLTGANYLRLPWAHPYMDGTAAAMYPFIDSPNKYSLNMYKTLLPQQSTYGLSHLAYSPVCTNNERFLYLPHHYVSPHMPSSLASPMRITAASSSPALPPLVHCQDKNLSWKMGVNPVESHAYQHLQNSKPPRIQCSKPAPANISADPTLLLPHSPRPRVHMASQPLADTYTEFHKHLASISTSPSSISLHSPYMNVNNDFSPSRMPSGAFPKANENDHPQQVLGHVKKAARDRKDSRSPLILEKQIPTKDVVDKPLDLSSKVTDGEALKTDSIRKTTPTVLVPSKSGCGSVSSGRDIQKDHLPPPGNNRSGYRPEIISNAPSSWVVPGANTTDENGGKIMQLKNKALEKVMPQPRSSSCPRIGNIDGTVPNNPGSVPNSGRPASASPAPNTKVDCSKTSRSPVECTTSVIQQIGQPLATCTKQSSVPKTTNQDSSEKAANQEMGYKATNQELTFKALSQEQSFKGTNPDTCFKAATQELCFKAVTQESSFKPNETDLLSSSMFLTPNETFRSPPIHYPRSFLPYPLSESLALGHLSLHGKGAMYPHPVLLPNGSLFPGPLAPKPGLPYSLPTNRMDYVTYQDALGMMHPVLLPPSTLEINKDDKTERRSRSHERQRYEDAVLRNRVPDMVETGPKQHLDPPKEKSVKPPQSNANPSKTVGKGEKPPCNDAIQDTKSEICVTRGALTPDGSSRTFGLSKHNPEPEEHHREVIVMREDFAKKQDIHNISKPLHGSTLGSSNDNMPKKHHQDTGCPQLPLGLFEASCAPPFYFGRASQDGQQYSMVNAVSCANASEPVAKDGMEDFDMKNRSSKVAKRIESSAGYVGDRLKCTTNEIFGDSNLLSREQRSLQMQELQEDSNLCLPAAYCERAMMRFSELELKVREGHTAAVDCEGSKLGQAAWASATGGSDKPTSTILENPIASQRSDRGDLNPALNGPSILHHATEVEKSLLERMSLYQSAKDARRECSTDGVCEGPFPGSEQKRKHSGEGLIDDSQYELSQCEEESLAKRRRTDNDDWPEREMTNSEPHCNEVTNLKVCIELTGLHPKKQRHLQHLRELWEQQAPPETPASGNVSSQDFPEAEDKEAKEDRHSRRSPEVPSTRSWLEESLRRTEVEVCAVSPQMRNLSISSPSSKRPALPAPTPRLPVKQSRTEESFKEAAASTDEEEGCHGALLLEQRQGEDDKPAGKRPYKTKHLAALELKQRRGSLTGDESTDVENTEEKGTISMRASKRPAMTSVGEASPAKAAEPEDGLSPVPSSLPTSQPPQPQIADGPPEVTPGRPMPPEVRRLIVNKNAGETLLQRAARLGYEEVVLYCLENKLCDVNHRDNAGYCALHEACARGWLSIVRHLLDHGADVNCSAQDGTRPIHDAVENDHLESVRLLLSYGADPTLATYSGRTIAKMTHSELMETFLTDYLTDLQGRGSEDPGASWEFCGSSVCDPADETGFDILANAPGPSEDGCSDVFEFEFSDSPLLPCYNIQVSLSQGPRNWFLFTDVLKKLEMTSHTFRCTFPGVEVITISEEEFYKQTSLSHLVSCSKDLEGFSPDSKELLEVVEFTSELQTLLGSSLEWLHSETRTFPTVSC